MKAHLLFPDKDFDVQVSAEWNEKDLVQDLELPTLFSAMAGDDNFLLETARRVVLASASDLETLDWRQAILKDTLKNPGIVRRMYAWTVQAIDQERKNYLSLFIKHPSFLISRSREVLEMFLGFLLQLRRTAEIEAFRFESAGYKRLFAMFREELRDEYLDRLRGFLTELRFPHGVLISARLGKGNKGDPYVLRRLPRRPKGWVRRLQNVFEKKPPAFGFMIAERDENGAKALSDLHDKGISSVANALAQSTDHILNFFVLLRYELAFYVAGVNLKERFDQKRIPLAFPRLVRQGCRLHQAQNLVDACLALETAGPVVGNNFCSDGKDLVIVTGANQGGKSTFLRSIGLAQVMAQCGLYVAAERYTVDVAEGIFTHFRRKEDAGMKSGKLDEELARMSALANHLRPNSVVFFNESFAATNEREGSEIAGQIVRALVEKKVKVVFVSHQYEFARLFFVKKNSWAQFFQAERLPDGRRTFKLVEGEPEPTSHGLDLFREVFS